MAKIDFPLLKKMRAKVSKKFHSNLRMVTGVMTSPAGTVL